MYYPNFKCENINPSKFESSKMEADLLNEKNTSFV